ncbi:hypothetical protein ACFSTC_05955 [Nonomuraea ferruginea]
MARLQAAAVVEAIPRDWFEEYVRALLDRAEDLRTDEEGRIQGDEELADVALVEGDHLTSRRALPAPHRPAGGRGRERHHQRAADHLVGAYERGERGRHHLAPRRPEDHVDGEAVRSRRAAVARGRGASTTPPSASTGCRGPLGSTSGSGGARWRAEAGRRR